MTRTGTVPPLDGAVEVFHCPPRTVVWLTGPVDETLAGELAVVAASVPRGTTEVVVDVARMTFADLTAARFIAQVGEGRCVTVRSPSQLTCDLLRLSGLAADVQIASPSRLAPYDELVKRYTPA
jgi:hypothetical protein